MTASREPLLERAPDAILFRDRQRAVTASRFLAEAAHASARLAERHPDATHVVNLCQDRYRFAVLFAACVLAGRISLLSGAQGSRAVAELCARYAGALPLGDHWLDAEAIGPQHRTIPSIACDRIVAIVLTSGSTGEPSATVKRWGELVARSRSAASRFGFVSSMPEEAPYELIGTVPPHHMYGFETTVLLPLHAPVVSWCGPFFYPADLRLALGQVPGRCTLVTTPVHLRSLREPAPARSPQQVISATASLDPGLAGGIEAEWTTRVLEIFGATEVGSIASRRTMAGPEWELYPGVSMVPEPLAEGEAVAEGQIASVRVPFASPTRLSDIVELAPDGRRFRLLGRIGDLVKLGGRRASLAGLSRVLAGLPGVEDGVFLAPDDLERRPGARLFAFAVAPARDAAGVLEDLRSMVDPVFLPRRLVLCDSLPRNATGKLTRATLLGLLDRAQDGPVGAEAQTDG